MADKVTLTFDASTKAIGWSLYKGLKLTDSGQVHVESPHKYEIKERYDIMLEAFYKLKSDILDKFEVDRIVMNNGYFQTNGVNVSTRYLKRIQEVIASTMCYKNDIEEFVVVDETWLKVLHKLSGFKGSIVELNQRSKKKFETVKVASWIKYGVKPLPTVTKNKGEWYDIEIGTEKHLMSDDEADAILCGWAFVSNQINEQVFYTNEKKMKTEKLKKHYAELNLLARKIKSISKKEEELNRELNNLAMRESTLVVEKSKKLREQKLNELSLEKNSWASKVRSKQELIKELKKEMIK